MPAGPPIDPLTEPEAAIVCYEKWSGFRVIVHDIAGLLGASLPLERSAHTGTLCQAIKSTQAARCVRWESERLRPSIGADPAGRIRVCHAGLAELVVPVVHGNRLALVLFAGQRLPGPDLVAEHDRLQTPLAARVRLPAVLGAAEAAQALEGLRQLASRLRLWFDEHAGASGATIAPSSRALAIHRFIASQHRRPLGLADLARHLDLSLHRTAHVVRSCCGRTFVELVTEARLRSASALLGHTDLSIADIAGKCGFGDTDHFHRVFRQAYGTTPRRYRLAGGGP